MITSTLPASQQRLEVYRKAQAQDSTCDKVQQYCQSKWPEKRSMEPGLMPYWKVRDSLTICNNLLLFNDCIVVPAALQIETLLKVHEVHQGIICHPLTVKSSVWWPGVTHQMVEQCSESLTVKSSVWWPGVTHQMVEQCSESARLASHKKEPMMSTPLPDYPWQVIDFDLCEWKGDHFLVVVDYFIDFDLCEWKGDHFLVVVDYFSR